MSSASKIRSRIVITARPAWLLLTIALLLIAAPGSLVPRVAIASDEIVSFVSGEIIVSYSDSGTFPNGSNPAVVQALTDNHATFGRALGDGQAALIHVNPGDELSVAAALYADPAFGYAEPNYIWNTLDVPNDPQYSALWALNNVGQSGGSIDADIDAQEAWDFTTGSSDVIVAVLDSGVDYTHPDLAANMWVNPNEIPGNGIDDDGNGYVDDIHGIDTFNDDSDPFDDYGHGTHVAGTIAAVGNNAAGVIGVSRNTKLIALKFLNDNGSGFTSGAIESLQYLIDLRASGVDVRIVNNSWGSYGNSLSLKNIIQDVIDAGILFTAAAGNLSLDTDVRPHFPSSYAWDGIIAVASSDHDDQVAFLSNWGSVSTDIAAPGSNILSTVPTGTCPNCNPSGFGYLSGTSMATPHVSGVAALLLAARPSLTTLEMKDLILSSVDMPPAWAGLVQSEGRLNANNALGNLLTGSASISVPIVGGGNDAYHSPCGWPSFSSTSASIYAGSPGNCGPTYNGFRFEGLGIPANATIISATVDLTQSGWGFEIPTTLSFHDSQSPGEFFETDSPSTRWNSRTTFEVAWNWPKQSPGSIIQTPSLVEGIQELVDRHGAIDAIALLESGEAALPGQSHNWSSSEDGLPAVLHVEYAFASTPNQPPVWTSTGPLSVNENSSVGTVVGNVTASDPDQDLITFSEVSDGAGATIFSINPATGEISVEASTGLDRELIASVQYDVQVTDGANPPVATTVTVDVNGVSDNAPVANQQAVGTDAGDPVAITLAGSDADVDPTESLAFAIATGPSNGTLSPITPLTPNSASVTYTPNGGFNGPDSFTFTANDGLTQSGPATVQIAVAQVTTVTPRAFHTATLLNDGTILLIGGIGSAGNTLASAEVFNPATGTITVVGNMTTARSGHTATLTADGRVWIIGGIDGAGLTTALIEVFDPATGTFS